MLKVPSKHEAHSLKVAAFFDTLPGRMYDQKHFYDQTNGCRCIAGWINYLTCHFDSNDCKHAGDYLGLSEIQRKTLFAGHVPVCEPQPKHAAKVLRHLAHTGVVDWNIA